MEKFIFSLILSISFFATITAKAQDILSTSKANISFFSSTPLEDIEANSSIGNSVIDIKSGRVIVRVANSSFQFPKKLMQEHFNENYMESEKYPHSTFRGKINSVIDLTSDRSYQTTISGILDMHGVKKEYNVPVSLTIKNGTVTANCTFKVKVADHGIAIPKIVFKNIAETVEVRFHSTYPIQQR